MYKVFSAPLVITVILSSILGLLLAFVSKYLAVEEDERVEIINSVLPGVNCGACGYPGCNGYATAIIEENAPVNLCKPGKQAVVEKIEEILSKQ